MNANETLQPWRVAGLLYPQRLVGIMREGDDMRSVSAVVVVLMLSGGAYAQVARFREQAKTAFDREMAREKVDACGDASNTRAIVECLGKENETTAANYKTYVGALRSMLGIMGADGEDPATGPTGKPLTSKELVKEFDATETAWQKYREALCTAAFDQFKGGTAAAPEAASCELMLVRNHLREIDTIYYVRLHN